jgi:glucose/arabinose dehydrogenase
MHRWLPTLTLLLALATGGCTGGEPSVGAGPPAAPRAESSAPTAEPDVRVEVVANGLEHVWDIGFLPDGTALVTERPGRIRLLSGTGPGAAVSEVATDLGDVYARGEGGLMGLLVHPDFAQTRRFTTCQTHQEGGAPRDIQLVTWELSPDGRAATRLADPLLGALPLKSSGRHSGCRPTLGPDGALYVGTGDSANPAVSQDRTRLGGKVLRLDLATGGPAPGNPFAAAADPAERLVFTYGHRNVQGVTVQPETGWGRSSATGSSRTSAARVGSRGASTRLPRSSTPSTRTSCSWTTTSCWSRTLSSG